MPNHTIQLKLSQLHGKQGVCMQGPITSIPNHPPVDIEKLFRT